MDNSMVSNEELLEDIKLTRLELRAYKQIAEGYNILVNLPDQTEVNKFKYMLKAREYAVNSSECTALLINLLDIASKRGLNETADNRE